MARYKANCYRNSRTHQGEHGNLSCDILPIDITSVHAADDVLELLELQWDTDYVSIELLVPAGNTAGLEISLGYINIETGDEDLTAFGEDVDATAGSRTQLLKTPVQFNSRLGTGFRHTIAATLGGTVTEDETVYIVIQRIFRGSN